MSLQYNSMLKASKICVPCTGRLFQLFEFNAIKQALGNSSHGNVCHLCHSEHIIFEHVAKEAVDALELTRWSKV